MTEEATTTTATEKEAETTTQEATATDGGKYSQTDVDSIVNKVKANLQGQIDKLSGDNEKLRKAGLTESEKQLEQAREEGGADALKTLAAERRSAGVREELLSRGIKREQLGSMSRLVDPETEDAAEAVGAVAKEFPELFKTNSVGGGGGRNAGTSDTGGEWTADKIEQALGGLSPEDAQRWWDKNGKDVLKYQRSSMGYRTIAPGQPWTIEE